MKKLKRGKRFRFMENKINIISLTASLLVIFVMSIGFSVLNRTMNITGELTYRPEVNMRITNLTEKARDNVDISYIDFSRKEIKIGYTSHGPTTLSYTVEVTNFNGTEGGILKIDNLPAGSTIDGYTLGTRLRNATGPLKAGGSTTFVININIAAAETKALSLVFDFEPAYDITYNGFSSTTGYTTETLHGATFKQNFGTSAPGAVHVAMGGSLEFGVGYTYENGTVTVPTVTNNITVTVLTAKLLGYDHSKSGLNADNVQDAIDEINKIIDDHMPKAS